MKWLRSGFGVAVTVGVGVRVATGPVGVGVAAVAVGATVAVAVVVTVAVGAFGVGVSTGTGVQVGPRGGITGAQSTSLWADETTASPRPPANTTWTRLMLSDELDVPLPPGICSFNVTVATPGMPITVFGGGVPATGVPFTTRFTNIVLASLLSALVPSQVLLTTACATLAVTSPARRFRFSTRALASDVAMVGVVVPLVLTVSVLVETTPDCVKPATLAASEPPLGASTTCGFSGIETGGSFTKRS